MKGNKVFAKRIKEFRESKGISQEDLATMFGYKKQAVSHWENNGKVPRGTVLERLAELFNTSSDYLLGITDDPISYNLRTSFNAPYLSTIINELVVTLKEDGMSYDTSENIERLTSELVNLSDDAKNRLLTIIINNIDAKLQDGSTTVRLENKEAELIEKIRKLPLKQRDAYFSLLGIEDK